jgi:hypothetical protein
MIGLPFPASALVRDMLNGPDLKPPAREVLSLSVASWPHPNRPARKQANMTIERRE